MSKKRGKMALLASNESVVDRYDYKLNDGNAVNNDDDDNDRTNPDDIENSAAESASEKKETSTLTIGTVIGKSPGTNAASATQACLDDLIQCKYESLDEKAICGDSSMQNQPYKDLRMSLRAEFARELCRFRELHVDLPQTLFGEDDSRGFAKSIFKTSDPSNELRDLAFPNGVRRKLR
jgi:hypothetical protein